jgi:hypothetical protein
MHAKPPLANTSHGLCGLERSKFMISLEIAGSRHQHHFTAPTERTPGIGQQWRPFLVATGETPATTH